MGERFDKRLFGILLWLGNPMKSNTREAIAPVI